LPVLYVLGELVTYKPINWNEQATFEAAGKRPSEVKRESLLKGDEIIPVSEFRLPSAELEALKERIGESHLVIVHCTS
jgi:hypothetical protein